VFSFVSIAFLNVFEDKHLRQLILLLKHTENSIRSPEQSKSNIRASHTHTYLWCRLLVIIFRGLEGAALLLLLEKDLPCNL